MARLYGPRSYGPPPRARSTSTTSATRSSSAASSSTASSSTPARVLAPHAAGGPRRRRPQRDPAHPHPLRPRRRDRRARAPLARRRGVGPRARRAAPRRPQRGWSPAPRASTATTWSASGARSSPVPEANLRVLSGRRDDRRRGACEYTPGHASHHVSYLHEPTGTAFVGDVGGVRDRRRPDHPADAAARHRPRALARVARHRRGLGARAPGHHPLRQLRATSRAARRDARGARPLGARWRARPTPSPTRRR